MDERQEKMSNEGNMEQLSLKLSKCLDDAGYDEDTRHLIIHTFGNISVFSNILQSMSPGGSSTAIMGSEAEGTSLNMPNSDADWLIYSPFVEVINGEESIKGHDSNFQYLQMTREITTPAGYTKLQVNKLSKDILHLEAIKHEMYTETNGRILLSNKLKISKTFQDMEPHGPAATKFYLNYSTDFVRSYKSHQLPEDVEPWFHRERQHGWPSPETCEIFKKMGCFVVGVGHQNSPECHLEWRISMSYQELYLMKNLNPTQYKCYILLKEVKKIIKQNSGDIISSYHCKTALFYTIENTDQNIWEPEKLYICLQKCLQELLKWVDDRNCPNYFIPEENMFETKLVGETIIETIQRDLQTIIQMCDGLEVFKFDDLTSKWAKNVKLQKYMYLDRVNFISIIQDFLMTNNNETDDLTRSVECDTSQKIKQFKNVLNDMANGINFLNEEEPQTSYQPFPETAILWFMNRINSWKKPEQLAPTRLLDEDAMTKSILYNKDSILKIFQKIVRHIQSNIATLLLAQFVSNKEESTWIQANQYITVAGETVDMDKEIKLATVHYISGNYCECSKLLLESHPSSLTAQRFTFCLSSANNAVKELYYSELKNKLMKKEMMDTTIPDKLNIEADKLLTCLVFRTFELDMIFTPFIYEACKVLQLGEQTLSRWEEKDPWLEIDPLVYIYFLMYESYEQLNNRARMNGALLKLEESVMSTFLFHPDVAWNVLGHIYVTKGWYRLALQCFRKSWEIIFVNKLIKPYTDSNIKLSNAMKQKAVKHNAAHWNIMLMLFGSADQDL